MRSLDPMNCPTDGTTLLMSERQGIEIDYCPECRGIWLDRGELDKLLDRAKAESSSHGAYAARESAPAGAGYGAPQPTSGGRHDGDRGPRDIGGARGDDGFRRDEYRGREDFRDEPRRSAPRYGDPRSYDAPYDGTRDRDDHRGRQGHRRKKSPFEFLGDIFD